MTRAIRRKILPVCLAGLLLVFSLFAVLPRNSISARLTLVEFEPGIYGLNQASGIALYKASNDYVNVASGTSSVSTADSTVFDLRTLSDTAFGRMFTFSQEVSISGRSFSAPIVADLDKDTKAELCGYQKFYETPDWAIRAAIISQDNSCTYSRVYTYADTVIKSLAVYDIDIDGLYEIVQRTLGGQSEVYRSPTSGTLPTVPCFGFNPYASTDQMDRPTFGDFDSDGRTDVIYYLRSTQRSVFISEYDPGTGKMDTVYRFRPPDPYTVGFAIGDFDQNGRTDVVLGSVHGYVHVIEAQGIRQYAPVWTGTVETYNAYLHMRTHDIDGNGKPEFWVGGDAYYNGLGITRFTCFESDGIHNYAPVHRIDLLGVFSFYAGNCFAKDVDGDGGEELFICIDQHVVIVKFVGSPGNHQYAIYYMKVNDLADQNSVYLGATLFDIDSNGQDELLITMDQVKTNEGRREFTRIYKPSISDGVGSSGSRLPSNHRLWQNYPNPFNSGTTIRFALPHGTVTEKVRITVYDVLGRTIRQLLHGAAAPGEYEVSWDGTDEAGREVGSGIYIIVMEAREVSTAIKAIYVK